MSHDPDDDLFDDDDEPPPPPHGVRFGEGQPRGRGRPRGSPNRTTIIKRVANRRHRARVDGKTRRLNNLELVLQMVRSQAALGNVRALMLQEKLVARFTPSSQSRRIAVLVGCGKLTMDEFFAVHGTPGRLEEEPRLVENVLAKFPHLKFVLQRRIAAAGKALITSG